MILTGRAISRAVRDETIVIDPFLESNVNPNSVDLALGRTLLRYLDAVLDPRVETEVVEEEIPSDGLILPPFNFHLGSSQETVGSNEFVPMVHAKSSTARADCSST